LLAALRHVRVKVKSAMPLEVPLVALGIVAEFHSATPGTIEPDGEAFIIQAHDVVSLHRCAMPVAETAVLDAVGSVSRGCPPWQYWLSGHCEQ